MLYITSAKMCQERRRIRVTPLQSLFFSRFFVFYFSSRHISAPLAGLYLDPVMQTHICDSHCYITINQATLLAFARTRGRMFPETCYCNSPAEEKKKKTTKKKQQKKYTRITAAWWNDAALTAPRQSICAGNAARSLRRAIQIYI